MSFQVVIIVAIIIKKCYDFLELSSFNDGKNYYPFNSAIEALLFMLLHSPRPLVLISVVISC